MKKLSPLLLVLFLVPLSYASAQSYSIPGSYGYLSYNNIGLAGEMTLELNVTLLNLGPYPKFVVLNPRYDFVIHRPGGEFNYDNRLGDRVIGSISFYTINHSVNYMTGFWIMPYETVEITFRISSNASYTVPLRDYQSACGETGHINGVTFSNGTLQSVNVYIPAGEIDRLTCGVVYPQLVNYPRIMSLRSMLPFLDRYIKVLRAEGVVHFRVINVPNEDNSTFSVFFAMAPPLLFSDAKVYDYYPNYTMTYGEYIKKFVWTFRGMKPPKGKKIVEPNVTSKVFRLTPTLLSGVSTPTLGKHPKFEPKFDFPVWIVFMKREVEITYRVSWTNSGR